ncbi:MAG: glycoside hydrolase family 9 protein, partial [Fibrobacterota bacterium]|nr:glycoside hydrolase family 9 protein [Fibrobacterota bacterium]
MTYPPALPAAICLALILSFRPFAQAIRPIPQDPQPYAAIANPMPDTLDQKSRDSANLILSPIRVNQAGYLPGEDNGFYYIGTATQFTVHDAQTQVQVASGTLIPKGFSTSGSYSVRASNNASLVTGGDNRYTLAGTPVAGPVQEGRLPKTLSEGRYTLKINGAVSAPFLVHKETYAYVRDALLKFFGVQRSGNSESWFHGPSHLKDGVPGGWYDCGDHLKEAQTQGYAIAVMGLTSAALSNRDADHYAFNQARTVNTDGIPDMLREAKHGADFILAAYTAAGGTVAGMTTSVGGFGQDHNWWGRPEFQDFAPTERGGPVRELRSELGANVMGLYAAGLAFVSGQWSAYDSAYASKTLKAARDLYAYGKANPKESSSPAYNGGGVTSDDMALAAIALAWATGEKGFIDDVFRNTAIASRADQAGLKGTFTAGWFVKENPTPLHGNANTSWATTHVYALWAFYRLILVDPVRSAKLGITESERLLLIRDAAFAVVRNISQLASVAGGAGATLPIPDPQPGMLGGIPFNANWNINLAAEQEWVYNRYLAGNMTELFIYYDIARDIQGMALPGTTGAENWKAPEARQLLIRSFDYLLGVN